MEKTVSVKIDDASAVFKTADEISSLYHTASVEIEDERKAVFCAGCLGGVVVFKVFAHGGKHRVGWCNKCDATTMVDEMLNGIYIKHDKHDQFKFLIKYDLDKERVI